ncbi:flavin reductase family protein [Erythrobacter sp. MTPC3]|uniref:flavin reductase family protein n=1 Tax=Erythrobacter sp. MTPC3 TaxID=3056564 RepID=UPI0036F42C8C
MSDNSSPDPVDPAEFRKLMGLFATGVCVVSFGAREKHDGARISGMTINSLLSVSLDPMLVCWSLQNASSQFAEYAGADHFGFSILSADQQALARRYAARGDSTLNAGDFEWTANGIPIVKNALAVIECRRWAQHPAGDHTLILGEVLGITGPPAGIAVPSALGFFGGHFCPVG